MITKKQLAERVRKKLLKAVKSDKMKREIINKINFNQFPRKNLEKAILGK